jgi:hypothetical protein
MRNSRSAMALASRGFVRSARSTNATIAIAVSRMSARVA